ncbi:MAG TPA: prephenate dehydratase [Methanomassiliicoccales archaeon]|nr:prephenate dehydratase [Methanomassiliicoccales archaeon]
MIVAFQGEKGAYSEDAVFSWDAEAKALECPEFLDLFDAVRSGRADLGMLPVENSIEGSVTAANDLLFRSDLKVIGEVMVHIRHCLIGHPDAELADVRRVYSHPQALAQCRDLLTAHPEWQKVPAFDTAGSVRMIKERGMREEAALASRRAASTYGMRVLLEDVQSVRNNITRFFVLSREGSKARGNKTALAFTTKNQPGALLECLKAFASHEVNITKLESRPWQGRTWEYVFYLDLDGDAREEKVAEALAVLRESASCVRMFGSFKKAAQPLIGP